jgi:hypothetical protein
MRRTQFGFTKRWGNALSASASVMSLRQSVASEKAGGVEPVWEKPADAPGLQVAGLAEECWKIEVFWP